MSNHANLPERQVTFATKRDFAEALASCPFSASRAHEPDNPALCRDPAGGTGTALPAALLYHPLDRGGLRPAVRPASLEPARGCPRRATRGRDRRESAWWRWL